MFRLNRYTRVLSLVVLFAAAGIASAAPFTGSIHTSDSTCSGVDLNIYESKGDVYLEGGGNGGGLPDGNYWVKVTEPNGTLLGYSTSAIAQVSGGEFLSCYRIWDILVKASDATTGYDDTTNSGGEYKLWASPDQDFARQKTDNFKVKVPDVPPPPPGHLVIQKFYDANADGVWNTGDVEITGWQIELHDAPHVWLDATLYTPADYVDEAGQFEVHESSPLQGNWNHTTPDLVTATITAGQTTTVTFGNLCLGSGGGLTLGFWSNKNGAKLYNNQVAVDQNLVDGSGAPFNPTSHKQFNAWILSASATNMAYMLSAQLAAMTQNVNNGNVSAGALVYAPGTGSANSLGYATIGALIAEANALLAANSYTVGPSADRTAQEAVKTALDRANNNLNFVQAGPCAFSF